MANQIDTQTKICGLLGYPIGHSVSPLIHNELAARCGQNLVYLPLQVEADRLGDAVKGADAWNFLGMNVTIPYKEAIIEHLKEIDPVARQIGACNTLVRIEGGYKGYNTDAPGLYRAMQEEGVDVYGANAVILGAGGVAKAIAYMLATHEVGRLWILNRTKDKAQALAEEVNGFVGRDVACGLSMQEYASIEADRLLVIQATSIGMSPKSGVAVIDDPAFYQKIAVGVDVIYNPQETRFMQLVKEAGGKTMNGLKMLLYQGIIAYELWNGIQVPEKDAMEIYQLMQKNL